VGTQEVPAAAVVEKSTGVVANRGATSPETVHSLELDNRRLDDWMRRAR